MRLAHESLRSPYSRIRIEERGSQVIESCLVDNLYIRTVVAQNGRVTTIYPYLEKELGILP